MTAIFNRLAAAALLGSTLMATEPAAAQQGQFAPTAAQKAACLKMSQVLPGSEYAIRYSIRSNCLKTARESNARLRADYTCTRSGGAAVYGCSQAEHKAQADAARAARIQREMNSEARALKKIQDERQRNKPTTEHCLMKNGKLECKPV